MYFATSHTNESKVGFEAVEARKSEVKNVVDFHRTDRLEFKELSCVTCWCIRFCLFCTLIVQTLRASVGGC